MRFAAILLTAMLAITAGPAKADPVTGLIDSFFHYRAPTPPVAGDCGAIAAVVGPERTWRGEFSGRYLGPYERYQGYSARGCFESELECRIWQQQSISYAVGPIIYMTCRQGVQS